MTDNEFLLFDRLEKIRSVIDKYGEENFYISFSGGKDSAKRYGNQYTQSTDGWGTGFAKTMDKWT